MSEEKTEAIGDSRTSLEVIAPTVEEAIEKGLDQLGVQEDAVDVEILDEGSRGVLGIGARQSRIRLTIKTEATVDEEEYEDIEEEDVHEVSVTEEVVEDDEDTGETETVSAVSDITQTEDIALHIAKETVIDLLDRMHIDAEVNAYIAEPDDDRSRRPVWVDVSGDDLSILIGHRAETLNALHYITSLILGKELGRAVPLVVDVQGYRKRRAIEVQRLAQQMADQAVKSGRRQILEPMPPNERRLVHIELRKNPLVTTESIGEGNRRKVTIIPVESEDQ